MRRRGNNNNDLNKWKYERKTILCSENLWASPDWARPDVQHDGDHLFNESHQSYYHHHHCHHYHHHHHRDHEQVKPGERVVFNCKVDLSCMVSTIRWWAWWLLWFLVMIILVGGLITWELPRVLITMQVFITVWCCNCSSLRSLTSYISWSVTLGHDSTSKNVLTTFKHLWRLMYLISSL